MIPFATMTERFAVRSTIKMDIRKLGNVLTDYQDGQFKIIQPEECKRHKRDIMEEFKGALQQVKDHMDGKIQLKSAEALLDELRQEQHL